MAAAGAAVGAMEAAAAAGLAAEVAARLGVTLRPHQVETMAALSTGCDVVVLAATGSGQTLAALAASLAIARTGAAAGVTGTCVLFVVPTLVLADSIASDLRTKAVSIVNLSEGEREGRRDNVHAPGATHCCHTAWRQVDAPPLRR